MSAYTRKFRAEQGLSLIELLIGMTLGLLLMGGALHVFINSKQSFSFSTESTTLQESARYIMEIIASDIRMAGYFGCGSQTIAVTLNPTTGDDAWAYEFDKGMVGYDGDDTDYPDAFPVAARPTLASGSLPNSDAFTILRANTDGDVLKVTGHNTSSAVIDVDPSHSYEDGHILVISDCDHAAVFQTTGGNTIKLGHNPGNSETPGNCTKGLGLPVVCTALGNAYQYGGDAFVMEVVAHAYFVDTATNGIPALYRRSIRGGLDATSSLDETEELAQGVEGIQLIYGEDTDNDDVANRYVDASDVSDWSKVTSVRIQVLMRSISAVTTEPVDFRYAGSSYTPTDRFLRKEFATTIDIRN